MINIKINQQVLDKAVKGLVNMRTVEHKRPKEPTRANINKHFVMRAGRNDKAVMKEV